MDAQGPYPLPEDPALADVSRALRDTGHWAWVVDERWNCAYASDELRLTFGAGVELAPWALGSHLFGPESIEMSRGWRFGSNTAEAMRVMFAVVGGWVLADTPGGRDELREIVDPSLRDMVDRLSPEDPAAASGKAAGVGFAEIQVDVPMVAIRIRDTTGRLAGTVLITKPAAGMTMLGAMASMADLGHLERMQSVSVPARRPAAILFADLEASSPLARRLSTASYFALGRRLVRAADQCVIDEGGLVGRHVGDGVVAFFLAESAGSESAAARSCISAARALRVAIGDVALRSELQPEDVVMRFGLHWGSTLFVGNITTADAGKSPRSATRSTRRRGSRPARAAGGRSPPRS